MKTRHLDARTGFLMTLTDYLEEYSYVYDKNILRVPYLRMPEKVLCIFYSMNYNYILFIGLYNGLSPLSYLNYLVMDNITVNIIYYYVRKSKLRPLPLA